MRSTTIVRLFVIPALATGLLAGTAGSAQAQLHDGVQCHKIKDSYGKGANKHSVVLDLDALDADFPDFTDCKVKVKAGLFCTPVEMAVTSDGGAPVEAVAGIEQTGSFVCHRVKCPKDVGPADRGFKDRFGGRAGRKFGSTPKTLCVPAVVS